MKISICLTMLLFFLTALNQKLSAQEKNEINRSKEQRIYYSKNLLIDSAKAEQVLAIQGSYKKGVSLVIADSSLSETGRHAKIQLLIRDKNRKLRSLLTPEQQQKIIPTTERDVRDNPKQNN